MYKPYLSHYFGLQFISSNIRNQMHLTVCTQNATMMRVISILCSMIPSAKTDYSDSLKKGLKDLLRHHVSPKE